MGGMTEIHNYESPWNKKNSNKKRKKQEELQKRKQVREE